MATLTIKNVGPIKEVLDLKLNKVNVFMGPQSSGKSTIAKIISYCRWVEKRRILDGFFREDFYETFKTFHKLEDTYFPSNAYFKYDGDYCSIEFSSKKKSKVNIVRKENVKFENSKRIYIPAERNFVASMLNLGGYKSTTNNNVMNFLYDWYEVKKLYSKENMLHMPELSVSFYHIESEDKDVVVLSKGKEIILQNASSGIQSMTPLYLLLDYLTKTLYQKKLVLSPFEREQKLSEIEKETKSFMGSKYKEMREDLEKISEQYEQKKVDDENFRAKLEGLRTDLTEEKEEEFVKSVSNAVFLIRTAYLNYSHSQFIIEEPEQNLFPSTQRDLVYHLLKLITGERDHQLTVTTHSPYVLYALNNCMMGHLVNSQLQGEEQKEYLTNDFLSNKSWIDPKSVSVWEIENGELRNIQDKDNIISENYFDKKMTDLVEEYYLMLNYYKNEK